MKHVFTLNTISIKKLALSCSLIFLFSLTPNTNYAGTDFSSLCDGVIIDDRDPCTIDGCDESTGLPTHVSSGLTAFPAFSGPILCYGGSITLGFVAGGGTPPYSGIGPYTNVISGLQSYAITDNVGCTYIATVYVPEPNKLIAATSTTPSTCGNSIGSATVFPIDGTPGYTFDWRDASNVQVGTSNFVPGLPSGNYTVMVTDANGCTTTSTAVVGLLGGGVPNTPGPISGPPGVCKGQQNVIYCVPADPTITSYVWTLPPGATGSSTGNCITINFSTKYTGGAICVYGVNACGNSPTVCISTPLLTTKPAKPLPISGSNPVCAGSLYTYCIPPVTNAASYLWTISGNNAVTILLGQGSFCIAVVVPANATGSFEVKVKAVNCKGNSDEQKQTVTILNVPATPSNITGPASVCKSQLGFYSVSNVPGVTYNWSVSGNVWIAGGQGTNNLALDFSTSTTNSAVITVTASNICGTSAPRTKTVAINPNCRVANNSNITSSSKSIDLSLYPNPASYEINIDFTTQSDSKCQINIYDVTGRTLREIEFNSAVGLNHQLINLATFSKGTYFMRLVSEEGSSISKFVVE